jgi:glycosyltransferase involved in cell wall biosynthesis
MFSRYETAGITFCESWATGTPVITTQVGIIPDCLAPQNGIMVQNENETDLCEKMSWMIDNVKTFDAAEIRRTAQRFTYDNVGKCLFDIYSAAVKK